MDRKKTPLPPALILVGGLGTRLRSVVSDRPKPMALVGGRPFLEWLLLYLKRQGVEEIVLAVGYKSEMISSHFGDGSSYNLSIQYSVEKEPMGTGGALKLAQNYLDGKKFFMLNGDTLFAVDLRKMLTNHVNDSALLSISLFSAEDNSRYGQVITDGNRIVEFKEKPESPSQSLINGGTILLSSKIFSEITRNGACSFEKDILPGLITENTCIGYQEDAYFIDIGLPETLAQFEKDLPALIQSKVFA